MPTQYQPVDMDPVVRDVVRSQMPLCYGFDFDPSKLGGAAQALVLGDGGLYRYVKADGIEMLLLEAPERDARHGGAVTEFVHNLDRPKLPLAALATVFDFYRTVARDMGGIEAQMTFYLAKGRKGSELLLSKVPADDPGLAWWTGGPGKGGIFSYLPVQSNDGAASRTSDPVYMWLIKHFTVIAETHSHDSMAAFMSGTDRNNSDFPAFQMVFGHVLTDRPEFTAWAARDNKTIYEDMDFDEACDFIEAPALAPKPAGASPSAPKASAVPAKASAAAPAKAPAATAAKAPAAQPKASEEEDDDWGQPLDGPVYEPDWLAGTRNATTVRMDVHDGLLDDDDLNNADLAVYEGMFSAEEAADRLARLGELRINDASAVLLAADETNELDDLVERDQVSVDDGNGPVPAKVARTRRTAAQKTDDETGPDDGDGSKHPDPDGTNTKAVLSLSMAPEWLPKAKGSDEIAEAVAKGLLTVEDMDLADDDVLKQRRTIDGAAKWLIDLAARRTAAKAFADAGGDPDTVDWGDGPDYDDPLAVEGSNPLDDPLLRQPGYGEVAAALKDARDDGTMGDDEIREYIYEMKTGMEDADTMLSCIRDIMGERAMNGGVPRGDIVDRDAWDPLHAYDAGSDFYEEAWQIRRNQRDSYVNPYPFMMNPSYGSTAVSPYSNATAVFDPDDLLRHSQFAAHRKAWLARVKSTAASVWRQPAYGARRGTARSAAPKGAKASEGPKMPDEA